MKGSIDLKFLREQTGKSQKDIAELIGVNQPYVSAIENGRKPLSKEHEELLIKAFGPKVIEKFRVDKIDARVMPTIKDSTLSGIAQFSSLGGTMNSSNLEEHDELIRLRVENKFLKESIVEKDERIAELKERIEELKAQLK